MCILSKIFYLLAFSTLPTFLSSSVISNRRALSDDVTNFSSIDYSSNEAIQEQ
ncbi:MAG: hypothetical protein LN575_02025 [Rickettsia endosymbiont of Gnoriste bilineata]|nr:hypothetical protein [Rickettsia endosymbiont of Gnoriste bilineata]